MVTTKKNLIEKIRQSSLFDFKFFTWSTSEGGKKVYPKACQKTNFAEEGREEPPLW